MEIDLDIRSVGFGSVLSFASLFAVHFCPLIRFYPFGITIDCNCYLDERTEKNAVLLKTPFFNPVLCIVLYRIVVVVSVSG